MKHRTMSRSSSKSDKSASAFEVAVNEDTDSEKHLLHFRTFSSMEEYIKMTTITYKSNQTKGEEKNERMDMKNRSFS
jgi:hypothetical protein